MAYTVQFTMENNPCNVRSIAWEEIGGRWGKATLCNKQTSVFTYHMTQLEQETFEDMENNGITKSMAIGGKVYQIDDKE